MTLCKGEGHLAPIQLSLRVTSDVDTYEVYSDFAVVFSGPVLDKGRVDGKEGQEGGRDEGFVQAPMVLKREKNFLTPSTKIVIRDHREKKTERVPS